LSGPAKQETAQTRRSPPHQDAALRPAIADFRCISKIR
jgi:hypothetical protein